MKVARRVAHTTVNPIFESPVFKSRGAVVFHPRARLLVPGTGLALGKRGRRTRVLLLVLAVGGTAQTTRVRFGKRMSTRRSIPRQRDGLLRQARPRNRPPVHVWEVPGALRGAPERRRILEAEVQAGG